MNEIVSNYLTTRKDTFYDANSEEFQTVMKFVQRHHRITPQTQLLEIGTGTGWMQRRCLEAGIQAHGLEIDPDLAATAREECVKRNLPVDIIVGNLDHTDIGIAKYDVIVANSTFEHVKEWEAGLAKVARALKPGGVLFFGSTNKWTFWGGEYELPLYGYLPDRARYWLRRKLQGDAIMDWGIDFNQFTFPQLRRAFRRAGFSQSYDLVQLWDGEHLNNPRPWKRTLIKTLQAVPPLKHLALTFIPTTTFICVR